MALIAVLWLLALLTMLATAVAAISVSHRRASEQLSQAVVLDALADSAIRVVMLRIITQDSPGSLLVPGRTMQIQLPQGSAEVVVSRESGRIDINTADPELLFALFAANGWQETDARALVARIEDWKDTDEQARKNGAELRDYAAAGLRYGPRNGPFESTDEVRQVIGARDIPLDVFESLTVYSHLPVPFRPSPGTPESLRGEVVRIRGCAQSGDRQRCRICVARVTGNIDHPMQIFEWRSAPGNARPTAPAGGHGE